MQDGIFADKDFGIALDAVEESLEVEFKRELDLSSAEGKAKLAQEIGALCNFGGGWIVLGRNDNGDYPTKLPDQLIDVDQDAINQITSAYLTPAPHCILRWMKPERIDYDVPIIRVPSVGAIPICGKKNGPQDDRKRTIGIRKGTYYFRTAGPVSAPIASPEEWQDVIRRCVLSDRTQLLGALSTMLERPSASAPESRQILDDQVNAMIDHWQRVAAKPDRAVNPSESFIALGFELIGAAEQTSVSTDAIRRTLQTRSSHYSGPHRFFDDQTPTHSRPYVFEILEVAGLQVDAVEDETGNFEDLPYVWRLAENLTGVEIVTYWEDTEWVKGAVEGRSSRKWKRGGVFWPAMQMEYLDHFLSSVWYLAKSFAFEGAVRVRLIYCGLNGRKIASANPGTHYSMQYVSRQDRVDVDLTFELDALEDSVRSAAVASLLQPVNRFFQGPEITAETVVRSLSANRSR